MRNHGQALIEFAVVIGIVVILAIGAIQALYSFYLTRQVRAATEEIADLAAIYGDTGAIREQIPALLARHQLDHDLAEVQIQPPLAGYMEPLTVTLTYRVSVRFYGLFDLPIPPQQVQRLSEGG